MTARIMIYIAVMAGVTYLIRMAPFVLLRRKIKSVFFRSVLYYLPYAVITAMIMPTIFYSTGSIITAAAGLAAAIVLALFNRSLIIVALGACVTVFAAGLFV